MEAAPTDPKKPPKPSNSYLKYSGLAFQMFGSIGLCAWIGYRLDQYFELKFPAFLLSLILLAFTGTLFMVYRSFNKD